MTYLITEAPNEIQENLTFNDLKVDDVFVRLNRDKIIDNAAIFCKTNDSRVNNTIILMSENLYNMGSNRSMESTDRVALVTKLVADLQVTLKKTK